MPADPRAQPRRPASARQRTSPLDAFRIPYFTPLWAGNLLHFFGTQVQLFTLQWLVTDLTESRTLIGLVLSVQGLTVTLLSPAAGVAADRFPRRDLLLVGRLGITASILVLIAGLEAGLVRLPHLFAFAVATGILTALGHPPTQTYVFDIVGRSRIQTAVALNSAGIGLGQMAGPGLAGILVAALGVTGSWLSAAVGLAIASLLLWRIPIRGEPSGERHAPLRELREGFVYVWTHPPVRLALFVCTMSFFNGALFAMRPVFARHVLEVGSQGMGLMAATAGLGNLLGALGATMLPNLRRPGISIALGMFGFSFSILLYAFAFSLPYILGVEFASGLASQLWQIATFTGLQIAVPEQMRGRVIGILFTTAQSAQIGGVFVGRLADSVGDQLALGIFGAIPVTVLAGIMIFGWGTLKALDAHSELD